MKYAVIIGVLPLNTYNRCCICKSKVKVMSTTRGQASCIDRGSHKDWAFSYLFSRRYVKALWWQWRHCLLLTRNYIQGGIWSPGSHEKQKQCSKATWRRSDNQESLGVPSEDENWTLNLNFVLGFFTAKPNYMCWFLLCTLGRFCKYYDAPLWHMYDVDFP